jgi:hypothetical protein
MNAPAPFPTEGNPLLYDGLTPEDEEALARFDAALTPHAPDPELLSGTPARTLTEALAILVQALTRIDVDRIRRRQSWWHRFSGADLEARLELEVAVRSLRDDMQRLAEAASAAERAVRAMRADIPRLDAAQSDHEALIDQTCAFLVGADGRHPATARLERRLGNLQALCASNRLARAQMLLAVDHLGALLDRYRDVEQLLFPVWQQHALAVAQSAAPLADRPGLFDQFKSAHGRLAEALVPAKEATP